MRIGTFTNTNDKGQIAIPKDTRDALGSDADVTLNVILAGNGICIYPVEEFITKADTESSYIQLLEKAKGAWDDSGRGMGMRMKRAEVKFKVEKAIMVVSDTNIIIDHLCIRGAKVSKLMVVARQMPKESLTLSMISIQELYEGLSTRDAQKEQYLLATIGPLKILPYTYETVQVRR